MRSWAFFGLKETIGSGPQVQDAPGSVFVSGSRWPVKPEHNVVGMCQERPWVGGRQAAWFWDAVWVTGPAPCPPLETWLGWGQRGVVWA